jgi:hypothetical protein
MIQDRAMIFAAALAVGFAVMSLVCAAAQNAPPVSDGDQSKNLLVLPYLAPTGQVVAKPGAAQIGPETARERKARKQDDKIMRSICSNC